MSKQPLYLSTSPTLGATLKRSCAQKHIFRICARRSHKNTAVGVHPGWVPAYTLKPQKGLVQVEDAVSIFCHVLCVPFCATIKAKNYVASWPDSDETIDVAGAPLVPGYIDIHHHGGGRVAYDDCLEVAAATSHQARAIGVDDKLGTLAAGYPGDVIVLDPETLLPKGIFFV